MIEVLITSIILVVLIISTYADIKFKEVPDWISYGTIFSGIGLRFIWSLNTFNWSYVINGIVGFIIFSVIAYAMFYLGQWGGGDSKLLMGIGALIGVEFNLEDLSIAFLINTLIVGAVYGLLWALILGVKNWKKLKKEYKAVNKKYYKLRKIFFYCALLLLIVAIILPSNLFSKLLFITLALLLMLSFYLFTLVKSVELSCMYKRVKPEQLTEGDWIARDIIMNKQRICGPSDYGIEKKQINRLIQLKKKKKVDKVLIKIGIPFVPSFLIAFILTLLIGNVIFYLF